VLTQLAMDSGENERAAVVGNPSTPLEVLGQLAGDLDESVRAAVAENPSTPPAVLTQLAMDAEEYVRTAVASNPSTPPTVLAQLALDSDWSVRSEVTRNPSTPTDNPDLASMKFKDSQSPEGKERVRILTEREKSALAAVLPEPESEGWHPDPLKIANFRWWNGSQWTGRFIQS
jgi:hypothetical protein